MNRNLGGHAAALLVFTLISMGVVAQDSRSLAKDASRAYQNKQYAECGRLYSAAIVKGSTSSWDRYNGACCYALAGRKKAAFELLDAATQLGWTATDHLLADTDLTSLHTDPRWNQSVAKAQRTEAAYLASVNAELAKIKADDQADRRAQPIDWDAMAKHDDQHYQRVKEMIAANELKVADDYYNAALIMQHGSTVEDYELAYRLASHAAELKSDHPSARWLTCAAKDRWLLKQGKPQIYGTQFQKDTADGPWTQEPFDRQAVSDEDRQEAGVRTLAESEKKLAEMNRK